MHRRAPRKTLLVNVDLRFPLGEWRGMRNFYIKRDEYPQYISRRNAGEANE